VRLSAEAAPDTYGWGVDDLGFKYRNGTNGGMLDPNVDAVAVWMGLALASLAVAGVVTQLPRPAPPEADPLARTVDTAAATDHVATTTHPVAADAVRIGPSRVAVRGPGGTDHATLAYGPVTPARPGTPLCRVARGARPHDAFDSWGALLDAAKAARQREPEFHETDRVVARTVSLGVEDVTLVCP